MSKRIEKMGAQGDVMFRRVDAIPRDAIRINGDGSAMAAVEATENAARSTAGRVIVAHSETGHHHYLDGTGVEFYRDKGNPLVCYLRLAMDTDVVHARPFDTHETLTLTAGCFEVRRQREYVPGGFRRVED
jgi:hypothetical protein